MNTSTTLSRKIFDVTVIITGLGYFIDMFDMFLFNMMRVTSLTELGLSGPALTDAGLFISNCQMMGFLVGAYLSGVLGDRVGRKTSLFVSIIIYSFGSFASGFVEDVNTYALIRFITGLGLAGELGAGLTLIIEKLAPNRRGVGAMIFITLGFLGALCSGLLAETVYWRTAYMIGGIAGFVLLLLRAFLMESGMYENMPRQNIIRGGLRLIFKKPVLLKQYIGAIFILASYVFIPQILWTLSPEIGKSLGIQEPIKASIVTAIGFSCVVFSDVLASMLSEWLKSRKKAVLILWIIGCVCFLKYWLMPPQTVMEFYITSASMGLGFGAWVVTAAWAAEHFGTNIRATAATTIPNFARALTIPMNLAYGYLKVIDAFAAALYIGWIIFGLAFLGWLWLSETYGKDLDYIEHA
jgi:MFS family permease